ncbi:MAG: hypothetical protein OJF51_004234 [Nitrospira sp.]|nr:MAG: hypothetical protein OJF51_004234 [Nitrospira sp.]
MPTSRFIFLRSVGPIMERRHYCEDIVSRLGPSLATTLQPAYLP